MGVILAIAYDAASGNGGGVSPGLSALLLLATLASVGRWRRGSRRRPVAVACHPGRLSRLWPEAPAAAAGVPRSPDHALPPDRTRDRPREPDPAASSSPRGAPPGLRPRGAPPAARTAPGLLPGWLFVR